MNACGEVVCCVIILMTQMVEAKHILGIQPWANIEGDPTINFESNSNGINKYYPHGLTCFYDGKEIETYITCSENRSITTEILADIMHYLNKQLTFDRDDATPYLLLDGHGSHFRLPFLEYINDDQHKRTVCIGIPYGTNLWQLGDSLQQNGAFKIALKKAIRNMSSNRKQSYDIPAR